MCRELVWCDPNARTDYKQNLWQFTTYSNTYVKRDPNMV